MTEQTAIVFAYHNIGVIGIESLLRSGVEIKLVVTHQDNSQENIWFDSVEALAHKYRIPVIKPDDPNNSEVIRSFESIAPQWIFSFYYRHMLNQKILAIPVRGAYNLHGSLLPRYRGRAPVNWAVLHGESETGVSLHQMVEKPDAGALVDQEPVSILPNDTAHDVFLKLTPAAGKMLNRCLPKLFAGEVQPRPVNLAQGSYFSGRRPEDGRIDWQKSAWQIHNLIRAVAPPYPGAFFDHLGKRLFILGSRFNDEQARNIDNIQERVSLYWENELLYADCLDGKRFRIEIFEVDGKRMDRKDFKKQFSSDCLFP